MALFGWFRSKKVRPGGETRQVAIVADPEEDYPFEVRDEVRKWVNRYFKTSDALPEFWERVADYKATKAEEPLVNDILWGMMNDHRLEYFQRGRMGLYRNETLAMAMLLTAEDRHKDALPHVVDLTVMDAAGAHNGSWNDRHNLPFQRDLAHIAPVCPGLLAQCAAETGMTMEDLRGAVMLGADQFISRMGARAPKWINGKKVWAEIQSDVADSFSQLNDKPKSKRRRKAAPVLTTR